MKTEIAALILIFVVALSGYISAANVSQTPSAADCFKTRALWEHIYNPQRLKIIEDCTSVTGTIRGIRSEADGDKHIYLKVDNQSLLNKKNIARQHGNLVLEPICVGKVTQDDAVDSCAGFESDVVIPPVGTHVIVTGSYVLDKDHGWMEIHPVEKFEKVRNCAVIDFRGICI